MDIKFNFNKINITLGVWLKLIGYSAAIFAGLGLLYFLAVSSSVNRLSKLTRQAEALSTKSAQYNNFDVIGRNMQQVKEKAESMLSGYENALAGAQKSQNSFLDQISDISIKSNIKLEKVAPVEAGKKKFWDMSFATDYASLCDFISELEKYYRVESFRIKSGQKDSSLSRVELRVSSLSGAVYLGGLDKKAAAKDIFELYDEVTFLQKDIQSKELENAAFVLVKPRDPMAFADTIFPAPKVEKKVEKKEVKKKVVIEKPPLTIEGIYYDPTLPVVVIGGNAMKEGEEVNNVIIEKIYEDKITVLWKGRKYDIKK